MKNQSTACETIQADCAIRTSSGGNTWPTIKRYWKDPPIHSRHSQPRFATDIYAQCRTSDLIPK